MENRHVMGPAWKHAERRIAYLLGGERIPITGRHSGDIPDVKHPQYAIEVKHWVGGIGKRIEKAYEQARKAHKAGTTKCPIVVIHQDGHYYLNSFVVLSLRDFIALTTPYESQGICPVCGATGGCSQPCERG